MKAFDDLAFLVTLLLFSNENLPGVLPKFTALGLSGSVLLSDMKRISYDITTIYFNVKDNNGFGLPLVSSSYDAGRRKVYKLNIFAYSVNHLSNKVSLEYLLSEIDREERLSESPLVLRHVEETKPPSFLEVFDDIVR